MAGGLVSIGTLKDKEIDMLSCVLLVVSSLEAGDFIFIVRELSCAV